MGQLEHCALGTGTSIAPRAKEPVHVPLRLPLPGRCPAVPLPKKTKAAEAQQPPPPLPIRKPRLVDRDRRVVCRARAAFVLRRHRITPGRIRAHVLYPRAIDEVLVLVCARLELDFEL